MIILGGSYYNGPKSIFTGTAIIKDVNKIVLQNGIYDRLYVSEDISKQEIVDTYTSEAAKSVKIESGINRIETIDVYGKTTQEGTGDASPDNVREIENAGSKLVKMVLNGSENWIKGSLNVGIQDKYMRYVINSGKNAKVRGIAYCTVYKYFSNSVAYAALDGIGIYGGEGYLFDVIVDKNEFPDVLSWKQNVSRLATDGTPIIYCYESVDVSEATGIYTGIEITQGDEYRCEIIELQDRLHEGDKVETNVQSEYDAELIVDGAKVVSVSQTSSGNYRVNLNVPDDFPVPEEVGDVPNAKANYLLPTAANTLQSFDVKGVFCAYLSAIYIVLEDQTITAKEAAQAYFNDNPLHIFYKSASGGTGKNVRRETHVKDTLVLDGNKVKFKKNSSYWNLTYYTTPNISSTPRCICNAFPGNIFYSNRTYFFIFATETAMLQYFESPDACNNFLAEQYAAGTPVTIEYELAQPEVFADEPVIVENKAGEYTVSFESTGRVKLKPVINQEGWSDDTIIDAGFNGDLAGGNVDFTAESIDKIRIKRRKKGTANWVDLKDITINVPDDFTFTFYDLFAANAAEYTYAVVPVIGDIEGNLSTADIQSMFNGFFIADKNTIYGTEYNVNVGAATKNEKSSVVQTLGAKYPFIIDNGYNNYYTVPISLFFYNPNLDWQQNVQYRQMIVEWLHNGTAKIFKSEDGRIWLAKVTTAPVLTPGSNLNITSIDFSITEIGESNSTEDLYNSGLLSLIKES